MATEFVLPSLGESIASGTLVKMLVETGDTIEEDQSVMEIETDKAVTEVPSTVSGTVGEILVKPGDKLKVGQPIFKMSGEAASAPAAAAPQGSNVGAAPASEQDGMGAGTDLPKEGGAPSTSSNGGAQNGGSANGGSANGATVRGDEIKHTAPAIENKSGSNGGSGNGSSNGGISGGGATVPAAPSVRRLARELGVDIAQVQGSGTHGRISYADVKDFLQRNVQSAPVAGPAYVAQPLPDFSKWGEIERQPMSGIRLATARHMARCWAEVPHVTQFDKADITSLESLRKKFGSKAEKAGGKLTVTAIALKVVASALKVFPQFNASIDLASEQLVFKKYVNIGVAVDTERGLVVPVIRDVDKKSIVELAAELTQIGEKARARKITLEDMQGGSFTITNLGGIGGTSFTPIVNVPEVAILGLARGAMEPVWNGSAFEPRLMLPLSLSYDHRVIDGADGARFTRWIASALEEPFLLSLEG